MGNSFIKKFNLMFVRWQSNGKDIPGPTALKRILLMLTLMASWWASSSLISLHCALALIVGLINHLRDNVNKGNYKYMN